jgi:flagellar biosynthetic protein FlhB
VGAAVADDSDQEARTEEPTPRRRERAYEEGKFALSSELTSGVMVFVGVGGLALLADSFGDGILTHTRNLLSNLPSRELPTEMVEKLMTGMFERGLAVAGALLGFLVAAALAVNFGQVGFHLNTERVGIDWERASPLHMDRLFSWSKLMRGLIMILKVVAVATVAWWILRDRGGEVAQVGDGNLRSTVSHSWALLIRLALGMAGTLLVIGAIDYGWQFWQFERSLYMTKQEIKDEMKQEEGDPQIRARIRKMQRETAQRKMYREVPKATVVVTNPTHLAVALRYEPGKMTAPKVIAKGAGHVAKRIVELARKSGVPVIERKPLAQALFKTVKIDREVPMGLYLLVAEVLAYVYKLKGIQSKAA